MPAFNRSPTRSQQNLPGRRRTSLEGGNRGIILRLVRTGDGLWGFGWLLGCLHISKSGQITESYSKQEYSIQNPLTDGNVFKAAITFFDHNNY